MGRYVFMLLTLIPITLYAADIDLRGINMNKAKKNLESVNAGGSILDDVIEKGVVNLANDMAEARAKERELAGSDYDKCGVLIKMPTAYRACIKDTSALGAQGKAGLKAVYAIQGRCDYLAGIDDLGLSYLCKNPNKWGCTALKTSQQVRNNCASCNGNNLWLRVYAASGYAIHCY